MRDNRFPLETGKSFKRPTFQPIFHYSVLSLKEDGNLKSFVYDPRNWHTNPKSAILGPDLMMILEAVLNFGNKISQKQKLF